MSKRKAPPCERGQLVLGAGRLGVDHRMDQPDFVARHCERAALGQRLKEILVVGDTAGEPARDHRLALDRPNDYNIARPPLFRSIDDQVVAVDPQRVIGARLPSPASSYS